MNVTGNNIMSSPLCGSVLLYRNMMLPMCGFFFFKQKTAYEMRISDWSSDVCSSDLPVRVEVTPQKITVERIAQSVHHVTIAEKRDLLEKLLRDPALSRVIVFTRTKHRANRVAEQLDTAGIPEIGSTEYRERVCQYV